MEKAKKKKPQEPVQLVFPWLLFEDWEDENKWTEERKRAYYAWCKAGKPKPNG